MVLCFIWSLSLQMDFIGIWLRLMRLSNAFIFPDPEPPIINILYGWSWICSHFGFCAFILSLVISSKLIIRVFFYYIGAFIFSFSHTRFLLVPLSYVSVELSYVSYVSIIVCFDWLYSFVIISTLYILVNFFSKCVMFLASKSLVLLFFMISLSTLPFFLVCLVCLFYF